MMCFSIRNLLVFESGEPTGYSGCPEGTTPGSGSQTRLVKHLLWDYPDSELEPF